MNSSTIQWADSTMNFWRGCTKVSAGCKNCYAEKNIGVKMAGIKWGDANPRVKSKNFEAPIAWNKQPWICSACGQAVSDAGRPTHSLSHSPTFISFHRRRVFSLSLGDWLDPQVPIEWLAQMLDVIRRCPNLTWQLVTKRPELFFDRLRDAFYWVGTHLSDYDSEVTCFISDWLDGGYAPPNIWIIASAEDQSTFDQRLPHLLKIPAIVHGLSCEPLLGPIDLSPFFSLPSSGLWVIVGGESGKDARPCHIDWIRSLVTQCRNAGVACFVKQVGSFPITDEPCPISWKLGTRFSTNPACTDNSLVNLKDHKGGDITEWPADLRIRQFPSVPSVPSVP